MSQNFWDNPRIRRQNLDRQKQLFTRPFIYCLIVFKSRKSIALRHMPATKQMLFILYLLEPHLYIQLEEHARYESADHHYHNC